PGAQDEMVASSSDDATAGANSAASSAAEVVPGPPISTVAAKDGGAPGPSGGVSTTDVVAGPESKSQGDDPVESDGQNRLELEGAYGAWLSSDLHAKARKGRRF